MTHYTLFLIVFFTAFISNGQTDFEDWKERGETALQDENYPEAIKTLEYAVQAIPKTLSRKAEGDIYNDLGVAYYQTGEYKKGIQTCTKALEFYQLTRIDTLIAGSMYNLGILYKDLGLLNRSMDYLLQSARIFERNQCWLKLASAWNSMGNVCRDNKEFHKAIRYHHHALFLRKKINHVRGIADSYQNLGSAHLEWGLYGRAEFFLKKALEIKKDIQQSNIVTTYSSLGRLYLVKGEPEKAQAYLIQAYELRKAARNSIKVAESLLYLANYYASIGENQKALELFHQVEESSESKKQFQLLTEALEGEIFLLERSGSSQILMSKYKELLFSKEKSGTQANKKETDRLEIAYDVERKDRELVLRRKQSRIDQLRFRQLLTASAAIFLLALIAWIAYYYIRLSKRKIELQKEEIKYLHYELSHRTKNYFSLLSGMLTLDKKKAKNPDTVQALNQVKRRLEAMSLVQHYLLDNSSRNNKEVELGAYFTKLTDILLLELFTFKDQPVLIRNFEKIYLDYDKAMKLAIVLNELICNAVEHGLQQVVNPELTILVCQRGPELDLVVKDNGPGTLFTEVDQQDKKGVGLIGKLLQSLNGVVTYKNENGCVAIVRIKI